MCTRLAKSQPTGEEPAPPTGDEPAPRRPVRQRACHLSSLRQAKSLPSAQKSGVHLCLLMYVLHTPQQIMAETAKPSAGSVEATAMNLMDAPITTPNSPNRCATTAGGAGSDGQPQRHASEAQRRGEREGDINHTRPHSRQP